MKRNIDEASESATVWKGTIESKTTVCQACGKPAGAGKFCNNCGASMALNKCPSCGKENAQGVKFCNECGSPMSAPQKLNCTGCGAELAPGTKFCGECGAKA
jgi:predicted amidophosphoribosyltransferase